MCNFDYIFYFLLNSCTNIMSINHCYCCYCTSTATAIATAASASSTTISTTITTTAAAAAADTTPTTFITTTTTTTTAFNYYYLMLSYRRKAIIYQWNEWLVAFMSYIYQFQATKLSKVVINKGKWTLKSLQLHSISHVCLWSGTPLLRGFNSSWPGGLAKMGHF